MLLAIVGTLFHHGIVDYKWIAIALVLGTIIGVPLGMVQMTAVPQRTALSHAFGALCVTLVGTAEYLPAVPRRAAVHDGGAGAGGHPRLAHVHRQPDGRRETAGGPAAAADHVRARTSSILAPWPVAWASPPTWSFNPGRPGSSA